LINTLILAKQTVVVKWGCCFKNVSKW